MTARDFEQISGWKDGNKAMLDELLTSMYDAKRTGGKDGRLPGAVLGIVKENWDQNHPGQVRVEYELGETGKMVSNWADVLTPYTASDAGFYFLPEVGNTVAINFINGSPNRPIVIGSLWNTSAVRPADGPQEKNKTKIIRLEGGTGICLSNEENKDHILVTTKNGLTVALSDEHKTLSIQDKEGKNSILLNAEKGSLTLNADKELTLCVGGTAVVTIKANQAEIKSGTIVLEGSQKLTISGQTTNLTGSQIQMKADASMKVESGGITEVKGNMVKVN